MSVAQPRPAYHTRRTLKPKGHQKMTPRKLIKARRQKLGMTQDELAKKMRVSRSMIANLENGNQKLLDRHFPRLAKALHTHAAYLQPR
jgi:transcriptional regulator with XRE-family HTH domain